MKRTVLISCITFIIGIFIGGLIVSIYFSKSIKAIQNISGFHYRTDLEDVAFKAYSHQSPEFAIWALEKLIKVLENEKDIGVIIDNKLSFEQHISDKINKANSIVGIIRRSFKYLTHGIFTRLFKALVRPHLEYANAVWNPYLKKFIIAIENVQRRATKMLPGLKDLSYPERLRNLKLPTLAYRRMRGDMVETYKILNGHYDHDVASGILCLSSEQRSNQRDMRGHTKKLFKRRARLNIRQKFFSHRVVDIWNDLPQKTVDSPSIKCFESRLDKHWQNQDLKFNFKAVWSKLNLKLEPGSDSESDNESGNKSEDLDLSL